MPMMESGSGLNDNPCSRWSASSNGTTIAEATTGRVEAQEGVLRSAMEGPNVGAKFLAGSEGFGAIGRAEAFRVGFTLGGFGYDVAPNLNTGLAFHNGATEASFLGLGMKQGGKLVGDRSEIKTPLGSIHF